MFGHTFKGAFTYDGKELSKDKAISSILPKKETWSIPCPSTSERRRCPLWKKGEHVLVGQKDCGRPGFCLCAHSCVSIRNRERR